MIKKLLYIALGLAIAAPASMQAGDFIDDIKINGRLGLSVGGTMPLGMPPSIRTLERYDFIINPLVGIDAEKPIDGRWGVMAGVRLERKGMDIDARVKNYHMSIVRGGESLEGMFTGYNHTREHQWLITIPVAATFNVGNVRLQAGPYVSYVTEREFSGWAYDGYLRVGTPTGPKVELGSSETERGSYDFSDDMRRFQWGVQFGADWRLSKHWGVFGMVEWGLNGIHKASFNTIEQTLHPIYGTVGAVYYW